VYTTEARVLVASIVCASCRDTNQFVVSNSQVVKLIGGCADCPWHDTVFAWTVTRMDGVELPINLHTTTTGADRRNLVIRSGVLQAGYAYRFAFFTIVMRYCNLCRRISTHLHVDANLCTEILPTELNRTEHCAVRI